MAIIPKPAVYKPGKGEFTLCKSTGLSCAHKNIAKDLNKFLLRVAGFTLADGEEVRLAEKMDGLPEAYTLTVTPSEIVIEGDEKGLFYGIQTVKQLISGQFLGGEVKIPCCEITDYPRFKHRGFMLDCSRHFFEVEFIKKMIDLCAAQKLNIFHWHLTDDQGWRVEIEKYPLLTKVGGMRSETRGDGKPVEGFYTKDDMREVVSYAKARYIDVLPEVDMPGHAMAAIAAYPWLSCAGESGGVATTFGIKPLIMCAGKQTTYDFIEAVLREMAELFPYKYFHIGGDEAVKTNWRQCTDCQAKMAAEGLSNEEQLQAHFTQRIITVLKDLGKTAVCWNESVNSGMLSPDCVMQYWREGGGALNAKTEIRGGRKTVISQFTPMYLDYPHGMHPLRSVYKFNPIIAEGGEENILGVECPLWTEYVFSPEKAEKMTFPRLAALAEKGWSEDNGSFKDFKERLKKFYTFLDIYDVNYTSLKASNPNKFIGLLQTIKHFLSIIDRELIATSLKASKETKRAEKARKAR